MLNNKKRLNLIMQTFNQSSKRNNNSINKLTYNKNKHFNNYFKKLK